MPLPSCRPDLRRVKMPRLRQRTAADGARRDLLGRRQVLLHQRRRDRQDVADVVEAVAEVVGRKIVGGAEIDAEQIANRCCRIRPGSAGAR